MEIGTQNAPEPWIRDSVLENARELLNSGDVRGPADAAQAIAHGLYCCDEATPWESEDHALAFVEKTMREAGLLR